MPPKKDATAESSALLVGFTDKETKLLAAAFVSSTAPDKFDYDVMATLTRNTAGSLKKMWPPVKKKAADSHASFAAFLGQPGVAAAAAAAAKIVKKRKAPDEVPEDAEDDAKDFDPPSAADKSEGDKSDSKKKKAPAAKKEKKAPTQKKEPVKGKGRPKKAFKKEESASEEDVKEESAENSTDGGDGLGEFSFHKNIEMWLDNADRKLGDEVEDEI
ncbi:hypothetical protein G6011_10228 [Alternaria panax]|uniref:Uncharacterized protein n=1 Tax=Alternaria panax TaxID=48097 RepID=A0AAD4IBE1_9PLEO|nr:hypothetical protein G6011_10228 [Alternaria panax]